MLGGEAVVPICPLSETPPISEPFYYAHYQGDFYETFVPKCLIIFLIELNFRISNLLPLHLNPHLLTISA